MRKFLAIKIHYYDMRLVMRFCVLLRLIYWRARMCKSGDVGNDFSGKFWNFCCNFHSSFNECLWDYFKSSLNLKANYFNNIPRKQSRCIFKSASNALHAIKSRCSSSPFPSHPFSCKLYINVIVMKLCVEGAKE